MYLYPLCAQNYAPVIRQRTSIGAFMKKIMISLWIFEVSKRDRNHFPKLNESFSGLEMIFRWTMPLSIQF